MRKFLASFLVVVLITACSPVAQSRAVQLPEALVVLIGMVVMVAMTAAFKWLGDKFGVDLSGRAGEVASAISAVIVIAINYGLGLVPAAYDNLLSAFLAFLIVFLGGAGFYSLFLRKKVRTVPVPVVANVQPPSKVPPAPPATRKPRK